MRYFVTLDGQEFSLVLHDGDARGCAQVSGRASESQTAAPTHGDQEKSRTPFQTEILCRASQGRAAVVAVEGHVFRVLAGAAGLAGRQSLAGAGRGTVNGHAVRVAIETEFERQARPVRGKSVASRTSVVAPMPGRVVKVSVRAGDVVGVGSPLLAIEAMKMENELLATTAGRVAKVAIEAGTAVEADQELVVIEPV